MKNQDVINLAWSCAEKTTSNIHYLNGLISEGILKECVNRNSSDNLTLVIVSFKNFKKFFESNINELNYRDNIALTENNVTKQPKTIQAINNNNNNNNNYNNYISSSSIKETKDIKENKESKDNSKKVLSDILMLNNNTTVKTSDRFVSLR